MVTAELTLPNPECVEGAEIIIIKHMIQITYPVVILRCGVERWLK